MGKCGGGIAISIYAVVSSIMTFVIMPASGISQGIQPIIGNNYGSGNYKRVMATLYQATMFSVSITCIIWLAVLFFPRQILAAFGGTGEMFQIGVAGLRINFCITPVLGFVMLATILSLYLVWKEKRHMMALERQPHLISNGHSYDQNV